MNWQEFTASRIQAMAMRYAPGPSILLQGARTGVYLTMREQQEI